MANEGCKPREILRQLVQSTNTECENIARDNPQEDWADRPYQAVRLFYRDLKALHDNGMAYASRITGKGTPSLFQELLLGLPVLVDLVDRSPSDAKAIVDTETFKNVYGMMPENFANEVKSGRIIPIINVDDPLARFSDEYLAVIMPILEANRIQLASFRTAAFHDWLTRGKVDDLLNEGKDVFDEYFSCRSDEEKIDLWRQLRIDHYRDPGTDARVVAHRWSNIMSLCPRLKGALCSVLSELRDQPAATRAEVLNGVKNLVSSPISAGRGGIFRAGPQHIHEISRLEQHRKLSEALEQIIEVNVNPDPWADHVIELLEREHKIPGARVLDYESYTRLLKNKFWETFRTEISAVIMSLMNITPDAQGNLEEKISIEWREILKEYRSVLQGYKEFEKTVEIVFPLVSIIPYADKVMAAFVFRMAGKCEPQSATPGQMLAQFVWKAGRKKWPPGLA